MFFKTFLCLSLFYLPISAQNPKQPDPDAPFWSGMESPQLFYQLPLLQGEGGLEFQFRISVNGQGFAAELLTLEKAQGGESVELLATRPDLLKKLYELDSQGNKVAVTAIAEGTKDWFLWEDLLAYNRQLKTDSSFLPIAPEARAELILFDQVRPKEQPTGSYAITCQEKCLQEYYQCALDQCGSPTVFCEVCLIQYAECLKHCCTPSTITFVRTTILSTVVDGTACLSEDYPNTSSGQVYQITRRNYKDETIQRTTNSYCVVTDVVISTSYYSKLCDVATASECANPTGKPTCNW